jgi:hypothetical protein
MTIERIISSCNTQIERYAQQFAQFYGVAGGGFAEPGSEAGEDPPLSATFSPAENGSAAVTANARLADATLLLQRSQHPHPRDRDLRERIPSGKPVLVVSADQPYRQRRVATFFRRHPDIRTLHVTGHYQTGRVADNAAEAYAFLEQTLATAFAAYEPGDPNATMPPPDLCDSTLRELTTRYPRQFEALPALMFGPEPGWLPIVSRLCEQIDARLGEEHRRNFRWMQIHSRSGVLRLCWRLGAWANLPVERPQESGAVLVGSRVRLAVPAKLYVAIHELVIAAESESLTTCEICGEAGWPRKRGSWRALCRLHSRPGWSPEWPRRKP